MKGEAWGRRRRLKQKKLRANKGRVDCRGGKGRGKTLREEDL